MAAGPPGSLPQPGSFWKPNFAPSCLFWKVDTCGILKDQATWKQNDSFDVGFFRNASGHVESSVKVVPEDDPCKRLWTCLLAPNHNPMMSEDSGGHNSSITERMVGVNQLTSPKSWRGELLPSEGATIDGSSRFSERHDLQCPTLTS